MALKTKDLKYVFKNFGLGAKLEIRSGPEGATLRVLGPFAPRE
jgi:hypothetical protein